MSTEKKAEIAPGEIPTVEEMTETKKEGQNTIGDDDKENKCDASEKCRKTVENIGRREDGPR